MLPNKQPMAGRASRWFQPWAGFLAAPLGRGRAVPPAFRIVPGPVRPFFRTPPSGRPSAAPFPWPAGADLATAPAHPGPTRADLGTMPRCPGAAAADPGTVTPNPGPLPWNPGPLPWNPGTMARNPGSPPRNMGTASPNTGSAPAFPGTALRSQARLAVPAPHNLPSAERGSVTRRHRASGCAPRLIEPRSVSEVQIASFGGQFPPLLP